MNTPSHNYSNTSPNSNERDRGNCHHLRQFYLDEDGIPRWECRLCGEKGEADAFSDSDHIYFLARTYNNAWISAAREYHIAKSPDHQTEAHRQMFKAEFALDGLQRWLGYDILDKNVSQDEQPPTRRTRRPRTDSDRPPEKTLGKSDGRSQKKRRYSPYKEGIATGYIFKKTPFKNGKFYPEMWYKVEIYDKGQKIRDESHYIPKAAIGKVSVLCHQGAPVQEVVAAIKSTRSKHR